MRSRQVVPGLILGLMILASCGKVEHQLVPVEFGRVDFIAADLLFDVRSGSGPGGRAFDGIRFIRGWARASTHGKWAVGSSAEMEVLAAPSSGFLWFECRPDQSLDGPQVVTVVVDGVIAGEFQTEPKGLRWYRVDLTQLEETRLRHVELQFSRVRSSERVAAGRDTRPLALMVRRLAVTRTENGPEKRLWTAGFVRTPRGVRVKRAGRLFLNFRSETPVEAVEVGFRTGKKRGSPVSLKLVHFRNGKKFDTTVFEDGSVVDRGVSLDAGGLSGAFQVVVDVGDDGLMIDRLQAWVRLRASRSSQERSEETWSPPSRPDIVVIVLDATRADHSGSTYEYSRETMPNIDRFAADSIVFNKVFAQAPYTSCSVPTMFTGLSWVAHGVIEGNDRLPPGEETLAEALRADGYKTIGLTATPNNSERLGMDQGFDEFEQLWEGVDWRQSIDPMFAVDRLEGLLRHGLDETPLFLMVHLVPPHSPYTPPDEFRRWSDPQYDGPCDGTNDYLRDVREHRQPVSQADIVEMAALYDGNLRFSDAAVGRILEALRDSGRLDRAAVVITSDHGEAFLEHGHIGHNSTIFDEMLQVPLIIRLPKGIEVDAVDTDRLVSLEDLTPTLLGLAGVASPPRSTGLNLFSASQRSDMLLRTTEGQSVFGFRSGTWKLMADRKGRFAALYDLETDPEERQNVLLKHPAEVSWIADRWDRAEALVPSPLQETDVIDVGLTDSEKAMLHELGYID